MQACSNYAPSTPQATFKCTFSCSLLLCFAASGSETAYQPPVQDEAEAVPFKSMLVQEGDPPMGRPVIQSKDANLTAEPPSASWGSATGVTPFVQSSTAPVSGVRAEGVTSHVPVEAPTEVVQVCCPLPAPICCEYVLPCFTKLKVMSSQA